MWIVCAFAALVVFVAGRGGEEISGGRRRGREGGMNSNFLLTSVFCFLVCVYVCVYG